MRQLFSTSTKSPPQNRRVLTKNTISEKVLNFEYAVRGKVVIRAQELEKQLLKGDTNLPFKRITYCNIGNPQQLGQNPITFFRQVLSLVEYPELLEKDGIEKFFPSDAISRAKSILKYGGTGAYSESKGREHVRDNIAIFINRRDGYAPEDRTYASPDNIYLSDGASPGVQTCLKLIIRDARDGIMIPIPQYPLYSASIPLIGGTSIPYYLEESKNWGLEVHELQDAIDKARSKGIIPRALVVINPGNPTGSCLEEKNMEDILRFCLREKLVLMADEVYQENIYVTHKPFISFKKKLFTMEQKNDLELISFHSTSKGLIGECGKRGGYFELTNIDTEVQNEIYKVLSVNLCPNITGQIMLDLMVCPPVPGDPSYNLYIAERTAIYNSLKTRAELIAKRLNALTGITCLPPEGALYAFPKIELPEGVVQAAKKKGLVPDMYYVLQLLEETGLCVVPGSGFGQRDGEYHFRTTILPKEEHLKEVLDSFGKFHEAFLKKHK